MPSGAMKDASSRLRIILRFIEHLRSFNIAVRLLCSARDSYQIQDRTRGNQSDNPHHAPIEHIYHMAISGYTGRMVKKQIR